MLPPHFKLRATMSRTTIEERQYMSQVSYANALSSLMYAIVCVRPDL